MAIKVRDLPDALTFTFTQLSYMYMYTWLTCPSPQPSHEPLVPSPPKAPVTLERDGPVEETKINK